MRSETLTLVRSNAMLALVPPPRLALSDWIEREVRLPSDVSSLPGPIRLYPFQHGMADAMSDPKIERVSVVKSARIGYTTLLVGLLGSHVVNEPAPVLFVLPTEDDCRQFVVSNVEPTFEASPGLAGSIVAEQGEKRNTLLSRRFPGGSLKVVAAKNDPGLLQNFVNLVLGEGWSESDDELDDAELASRAEAFSLDAMPLDVLAMTAGVDVQRDRLEVTFVGWSWDGTAYVLGSTVIWGLPDTDATWAELDNVLKMRFAHPLGGKIGLDSAAIDSGDGETMEKVYRFCFPRSSRKVLAIKGVEGNRPWIEKSKQKIGGGALWIVGVDGIKHHLTARLSRGKAIRFSDSLPPVWFEQLAGERLVLRYSRGRAVRRFEEVPGRRHEALDCTVYAFAARQIINVNWDQRTDDLRDGVEGTALKVQAVTKSKWMR